MRRRRGALPSAGALMGARKFVSGVPPTVQALLGQWDGRFEGWAGVDAGREGADSGAATGWAFERGCSGQQTGVPRDAGRQLNWF